MAGETINPIQVGAPRLIRMQHAIVNAQMYLTSSFDQPLPQHYWLVDRVSVTMQANAAAANTPPVFCLYSAPSGVFETASGILQGVNLMNSPGPQSGDLVLLDSGMWSINGATNIWPYLVSDENHPAMLPENRIFVCYVGGYTTTGAVGMVQVEIQYTDWLIDRPKNSPLPDVQGVVSGENI